MATKKKTTEMVAEPEVREEVSPEKEEKLLADELERLRREREELLKENETLKAEAEEYKTNDIDMVGEHDDAYWNERILYTVPFNGEEEDVSVKVTYGNFTERILVKRGETVEIKRKFAAVLENQEAQRRESRRLNSKLQDDFEKQTKQFLG